MFRAARITYTQHFPPLLKELEEKYEENQQLSTEQKNLARFRFKMSPYLINISTFKKKG